MNAWRLAALTICGGMAHLPLGCDDGSGAKMIADVTINLSCPILDNGGTVIVLPTKDSGGKIKWVADQMATQVTVSAQLSIVLFDYPSDGTYTFRFGIVDARRGNTRPVLTQPIGYGTGGYLDTKSDKWVELEDVQTIMIMGKDSEKSKSLKERVRLTEILKNDPQCKEFTRAKVCTERM